MKTITICDKEYEITCNAYTRFQYKKIFGRGMFADLKAVSEFSVEQEKILKELKEKGLSEEEAESRASTYMMEHLDDFIDVIEKIAYILIYSANNKIEKFEDWLAGIEKVDLSADWISEVTELAVSSFL